MRRAAAGIPTSSSSAIARARACRRAQRQVGLDRLDQLPADRVQRIERRQRILEHRADLAPADPAHRLVRQVVDAPAGEPDLAAGDATGRVDEPDDRRAGERLAGAGFADHAQHLARRDVERDVVDRRSVPWRVGNSTRSDDREQRRGGGAGDAARHRPTRAPTLRHACSRRCPRRSRSPAPSGRRCELRVHVVALARLRVEHEVLRPPPSTPGRCRELSRASGLDLDRVRQRALRRSAR